MRYMRMGARPNSQYAIDLSRRSGPSVSNFKGQAIPFTWFNGDVNWLDYGGTWISRRHHNGDWGYWIIIEFSKLSEGTYCVDVSVVAPAAVNLTALRVQYEEVLEYAHDCQYEDPKFIRTAILDELYRYGLKATLVSLQGANAHELLRQAKREATAITGMFGFYMDRALNRIGDTGWNFVSGRAPHDYDMQAKAELLFALSLALVGMKSPLDGWALELEDLSSVWFARIDDPKYTQCSWEYIGQVVTLCVDEWFTKPFEKPKKTRKRVKTT